MHAWAHVQTCTALYDRMHACFHVRLIALVTCVLPCWQARPPVAVGASSQPGERRNAKAMGWSLGALLSAMVAPGPLLGDLFQDLHLLQWNPHWQCTAWNVSNCAFEAGKALSQLLRSLDIDFANIIEYREPGYVLPEPWSSVPSATCGLDVLDLVYNRALWAAIPSNASNWTGCMQEAPADRPFLIQEFARLRTSERLVVVAAHFPHPPTIWSQSMEEAVVLKKALREVLGSTATRRVLLIADTNEYPSTSNRHIAEYLGFPGGVVVNTSLEPTCCFDTDFAEWGTFDRILANFGDVMETRVLFDPLPEWAKEQRGGRRGAFHKAIHGVLRSQDWPLTPGARMWSTVLLAIFGGASALAWCCRPAMARRTRLLRVKRALARASPEAGFLC